MSDRRVPLLHLALVGAVAVVYLQTLGFAFVNADDPVYVSGNAQVLRGVEPGSVAWAFRTTHAANWHPLTWLSHMLDVELYGDRPGGHHATSAVLHAANVSLLFWLLRVATGALWRSALVAALFALHPLAVESVAWVSERKNVLSTFFGLLSLAAYVGYARRGGAARYAWTTGWLALGLMAKPMLVTWPFVFLLLDHWPLRRVRLGSDGGQPTPLRARVREKLPWFAMSLVSSVVTLVAQSQGGAVRSVEALPWWERVANASVSYATYLGMLVWPRELSLLYPHPYLPGTGGEPLSGVAIAAAAVVLIAVTAVVLASGRAYARVGWAWYLGTLVPVIGLVQVGSQAIADRYTYVPAIGVFLAVVWAAGEWVESPRVRRIATPAVRAALCAVVLCALGAASFEQARYWQSSHALFSRAVRLAPQSAVIQLNAGLALRAEGRVDEAIAHYERALELAPDYAEAHVDLGSALRAAGRRGEAVRHYRSALALDPERAETHFNLGNLLRDEKAFAEAISHYQRAETLRPGLARARRARAETHFEWGNALFSEGRDEEALEQYERALALAPEHARARYQISEIERARSRTR